MSQSDDSNTAQAQARLWKEIEHQRLGMLGLVGPAPGRAFHPAPFQPMTAFAEPADGQIWFFTRKDSDLAVHVADGSAEAMFVVQAKDQKFQACVSGRLETRHDGVRIDRYWSPIVAAWFPDGKDDPSLTLLRLETRDAAAWITEVGPVRFAWEIARANLAHVQPDLGRHAEIDLAPGGAAGPT
jgi:general stress protein 26